MEQEKQENKEKEENKESIAEETLNLQDLEIGEDKPQIAPKTVVVEELEIRKVEFKDKEGKHKESHKLVLKCKHPEVDEVLEITSVKYEVGDKIKTSGLWIYKDNEGKLPFNSAVSKLVLFKGKRQLADLKGEQLETTTDDGGYLIVKAY